MRALFDEQLGQLRQEIVKMGALCENAIALSAKALFEGDAALNEQAAVMLSRIDRHEHDIEALCLRLLLQQQPVAGDLRVISSALKLITDMERIGDQSANIAEIISTAGIVSADSTPCVRDMALAVIKMVTDSVDAFVRQDIALAHSVISYDDVVDGYFDAIKHELIEKIRHNEKDGEYALDLIMVAKYLERIGDHAVNIAKWVIFSITGEHES